MLTKCRKFLASISKAWEERERSSFSDRCIGACHRGHGLYEELCLDMEYLAQIEEYISKKEREAMDELEEDEATTKP